MSEINAQQRILLDKAIELSQENKRLREKLTKVTQERDATQATMDAVITAFLRTGAPAPNITDEHWGVRSYRIVQNDGFFTISRTDEETDFECRDKPAVNRGGGLTGKERRALTITARLRLRRREPRITAFLSLG